MGGNALAHLGARRLPATAALSLADRLTDLIRRACPGALQVAAIPAYASKPDFGDLDLLVAGTGYDRDAIHRVLSFEFAAFGEVPRVSNGPVESLGVPLADGGLFQVDLIRVSDDAFAFALNYFAYNDLGNLIGRVAHRMDLKFGHDGLWYPLRDGTHLAATVLVTQDYPAAIAALGFADRRGRGFTDLDEIYRYVAASRYFNAAIYLLENRGHKARVRDAKRPTYTGFLEWLRDRPDLPAYPFPGDNGVWLPLFEQAFPAFATRHRSAIERLARARAVRERFSGDRVREWTGLEGPALGELIQRLRGCFATREEMDTFIQDAEEAMLREWVTGLSLHPHPSTNGHGVVRHPER